ncbi:MAG: M67 family metallopeptidase [Rhodospirillaceae bacterium]|nr:M67 family metallopeptidase [Rhodospirillaceae bacterium]MBT4588782.1 M67 family metallopeptidase [Rhodospirillaceae bacterium]MBT4938990.1 M67 family metallopeptidase [Rhodospirillaceae bacterium]MBT5940173.1 M67 family metallopeptidase [Rhodospirillaceae bacterium]MBT7267747.1 M67 family metallopeptidase [Rhodospirillaceae bacterium]
MIQLDKFQFEQIEQAARAAYPAECCGLLVGKRTAETVTLSRIVPSVNLLADQGNDRFEIDPQIRINLERELRGSDDSIVGHYHSHPDHPAQPSETDLEQAFEPDLIWLIVSVRDDEATDVKAHMIDPATGTFVEISCQVK